MLYDLSKFVYLEKWRKAGNMKIHTLGSRSSAAKLITSVWSGRLCVISLPIAFLPPAIRPKTAAPGRISNLRYTLELVSSEQTEFPVCS